MRNLRLMTVTSPKQTFSLWRFRRAWNMSFSLRGLFRFLVVSLQRFSHHVTSPLGGSSRSLVGSMLLVWHFRWY